MSSFDPVPSRPTPVGRISRGSTTRSRCPVTPVGAVLATLLLSLGACGPGDDVEITQIRRAPPESAFARADATSRERFGGGQAGDHEHTQPAANPFVWETPAGWIELAPQQFRDINFRPGGHPDLQCYLTILQGDGGGLTANVNRWRSQLGLDSITDEAAAALPAATLFGRPAVRVELSTDGDGAQALLGVIFLSSTSMATVKMTGPAALVEEQRAGFDLFCSTLAARQEAPAAPAQSARPPSSGLTYDVPQGWTDAGASNMRIVNLLAPGSSQCYVIRLAGEAGGLVNNLNRWRGEVDLEPIGPAELDALPKVEVMGQQCSLLEVSGDYQGMSSQAGGGMTLLGVALIGAESSLFVKMVGPAADMAAEKENFIGFLGSLNDG